MNFRHFAPCHQLSFATLPSVIKLSIALLVLASTAIAGFGQETYKIVYTFPGSTPYADVIQGLDGNLYGTTTSGGANGEGTVYKLTPSGTLTTIYSFCSLANCADGAEPETPLVLGTDGNFYGTTVSGGTGTTYCGLGCGTVFMLTPNGLLTTLHDFCSEAPCDDGSQPAAGLVQGADGNFYGTTPENGGTNRQGTVYRISTTGTLTTLYAFCAQNNCADGETPRSALIQGTNGQFYGTTEGGGANGYGEIFEITRTGTLTILHSFDDTDGSEPFSPLLQANNGNFYGMTQFGGTNTCSLGYLCGTLYEMKPSGSLTTLVDFDSTNGSNPVGGFVQGGDGNLYGVTGAGGTNGGGTIFRITPSGTLTTLHNFCASGCTDGFDPFFGIYQATNGLFYGIAGSGQGGDSMAFSFSNDLKRFVDTLPTSGKVGTKVTILGNDLTGSTAVSFNGTTATFTVVSGTEITTTVPTGATTGIVEVKTPSGVVSTTVKFRVP
jgi:uncharacterized repeat protein (TIGR03803 family)